MNRRNFLKVALKTSAAAAVLIPTKGVAGCIVALCNPKDQPNLVGTDTRNPLLSPKFCTSDLAHDLMTVQWDGSRWIRLNRFAWYYGLMYPNGSAEFYGTKVSNQRCWDRQNFHHGTRAVMWMNCLSRDDYVTWTRYWFITDPITSDVDSVTGEKKEYILNLYHTESVDSYEDAPAPNTAPPFVRLIG